MSILLSKKGFEIQLLVDLIPLLDIRKFLEEKRYGCLYETIFVFLEGYIVQYNEYIMQL